MRFYKSFYILLICIFNMQKKHDKNSILLGFRSMNITYLDFKVNFSEVSYPFYEKKNVTIYKPQTAHSS